MIKEALELLIENNVLSLEDIVEAISLDTCEIENLCFLPSNYFKNNAEKQSKHKLSIVKQD